MTQWVEVRNGDTIIFNKGTGKGSVVLTEGKGNYFMPAKLGMRIKGIKKPIVKNEEFIYNGSIVQSSSGKDRIVKCKLLRLSDNVSFAVSEFDLWNYFSKLDRSNLGGVDIWTIKKT